MGATVMRLIARASSFTFGTVFCGAALCCLVLKGDMAAADGAAPPAKPAVARTVRVVVLDPQGKPVADANVHVGIWTEEKDFKRNRDYKTDTTGTALIELPKTYSIVRLWAS